MASCSSRGNTTSQCIVCGVQFPQEASNELGKGRIFRHSLLAAGALLLTTKKSRIPPLYLLEMKFPSPISVVHDDMVLHFCTSSSCVSNQSARRRGGSACWQSPFECSSCLCCKRAVLNLSFHQLPSSIVCADFQLCSAHNQFSQGKFVVCDTLARSMRWVC